MPSSKMLKYLLYWAFLTIFVVLALLGAAAAMNYSKISGGTCQSLGGGWERSGDILVCKIKEK